LGARGGGKRGFSFLRGSGCVPNVFPSGSQGVPELFLKMFPTSPNKKPPHPKKIY